MVYNKWNRTAFQHSHIMHGWLDLFFADLSKHLVTDYQDVKTLMDRGNIQRYYIILSERCLSIEFIVSRGYCPYWLITFYLEKSTSCRANRMRVQTRTSSKLAARNIPGLISLAHACAHRHHLVGQIFERWRHILHEVNFAGNLVQYLQATWIWSKFSNVHNEAMRNK